MIAAWMQELDLDRHEVMLARLVHPELVLPRLDGHILKEVCIPL